MYLLGYSLDNLSLMASPSPPDSSLTMPSWSSKTSPATWKRHEALRGTMLGAKEIGFTVLSMSASLVAVFIPILMFPGIVGACSANSPSP